MRRVRGLVGLVGALLLSGCFASANEARVSQTRSAEGWFCMSKPVISCGDHECSGWDDVWYASCGADRYICKFGNRQTGPTTIIVTGSLATTQQSGPRVVQCQRQ